jgi:hypothetical protein
MAWDLMGSLLATFDNPERADTVTRKLTSTALQLMATRCSIRDAFTLVSHRLFIIHPLGLVEWCNE